MAHGLFPDLVLVYALALAIIILSGWLRIPPIIALIVTGVVSGPSALALVESAEAVDQLAEIGIVLLLFTVGLEFPMGELRRIWKSVLAGGALQVGLTVAVVAPLAQAFGASGRSGVFIGLFLLAVSMNEYIDPRSRLARMGSGA